MREEYDFSKGEVGKYYAANPNFVVITGSRTWTNAAFIEARLEQEHRDTIFVEGGARGADFIARWWCRKKQRNIITVAANWSQYGKAAGHIRNIWMVQMRPRLVIAFWDGESKGTKDMIDLATAAKIDVEVHQP